MMDIPDFADIERKPYYEVETVGAGWGYACDIDFYYDQEFALEEALRRASTCPEFCTRVLLSDLKGGASPIWVSRRDPDQDPDIAAVPPDPFDPA